MFCLVCPVLYVCLRSTRYKNTGIFEDRVGSMPFPDDSPAHLSCPSSYVPCRKVSPSHVMRPGASLTSAQPPHKRLKPFFVLLELEDSLPPPPLPPPRPLYITRSLVSSSPLHSQIPWAPFLAFLSLCIRLLRSALTLLDSSALDY